MARVLKRDDILNILYGATLLGAGGGGSLQDGLKNMADMEKTRKLEVTLLDQSEMEDDAYACVVAGVGSPKVLREHLFHDEALHVFDALTHASFFEGKRIKYLISGELGGFNTFTPMLVALEKGLSVVDCDGCGRAVPGLDVTLFNVHGIPTRPLAVSAANGDSIIAYPANAFDGPQCESIARNFCQSCGNIAAFGTWLSSKSDVKDKLACGAITFAETVGKKILEAKAAGGNAAEYIASVLPCREICTGVITKKTLEVRDGWDWGFNEITTDDGTKFFIDFKNENIVARDEAGKVYLTAPDHISLLEMSDYTPLSNSDTAEGQRVQVMAMPVHENWWTTPAGVDAWKPYYECVGYNSAPVRF